MRTVPVWNSSAALLLAPPMAMVIAGVFAWGQALPALALLGVLAAVLGAVGGPCVAPVVALILGLTLPASALAAQAWGYALPASTALFDAGVPLLLALGAAWGGAMVRRMGTRAER
jgi:hypothetical protein